MQVGLTHSFKKPIESRSIHTKVGKWQLLVGVQEQRDLFVFYVYS